MKMQKNILKTLFILKFLTTKIVENNEEQISSFSIQDSFFVSFHGVTDRI